MPDKTHERAGRSRLSSMMVPFGLEALMELNRPA